MEVDMGDVAFYFRRKTGIKIIVSRLVDIDLGGVSRYLHLAVR